MKSFALIWQAILDSSLWINGSKEARILFVTQICLKDKNGEVHIQPLGLSRRANLTYDETLAALVELQQPDPLSGNKEHEGRRIIPLPSGDGWLVVSHKKYQFSTEAKRAYWAERQKASRAKRKPKSVTKLEQLATKALESGDEHAYNQAVDASLPAALQ